MYYLPDNFMEMRDTVTKSLLSGLLGPPGHHGRVDIKEDSLQMILYPLSECHGLNVPCVDQRLDAQIDLISRLLYQAREGTSGTEADERTVKHLGQVEKLPGNADNHIHLLASFDHSLNFLET